MGCDFGVGDGSIRALYESSRALTCLVALCRAKSTYVAPLKIFRGCYQCSLACVDPLWGSISGSGSAVQMVLSRPPSEELVVTSVSFPKLSSLSSHPAKCEHFERSVDSPIFSATIGPADTLLSWYSGISRMIRFDGAVLALSLICSGDGNCETIVTSLAMPSSRFSNCVSSCLGSDTGQTHLNWDATIAREGAGRTPFLSAKGREGARRKPFFVHGGPRRGTENILDPFCPRRAAEGHGEHLRPFLSTEGQGEQGICI